VVAGKERRLRIGLLSVYFGLFDAATQQVLPVGFGVLAEDQLAERIFALTSLEAGHDF